MDTEDYSKESMQEQDEAEEETLSLCDLPIYSDAAEWEKCLSKQDQSLSSSSSASSSNQEFFEFFSEDWSTSSGSTRYPVENIVFCGKLISFKEPISDTSTTNHHKQLESKKQLTKPRKLSLFRWKSKLFSKRRTSKPTDTKAPRMNKTNQPIKYISSPKSSALTPLPAAVSDNKYGYNDKVAKGGGKYGFSVRKVSILTSPAAKSRWNLLMFGLARLPAAEMELSDIRSRQSHRRSPSALFRPNDDDDKVSRGKGLWWLIRALGCGGSGDHHHRHAKPAF